jgi:iron complex outermembrane receptor protein
MKTTGRSTIGLALVLKTAVLVALGTTIMCSVCSSAQDEAVQGTVVDPSGGGIAHARIQFSADNQVVLAASTDATGSFRVDSTKLKTATPAAADSYTLTVSATGFKTATSRLQLGGPLAPVTITLQIAPLRESISVTTQEPGNAASTSSPNQDTLTAREIERGDAADVGEALSAMDGLWMKRTAAVENDVVVRGFKQDDLNLLVDGARIYESCPSQMDPPAGHVDLAEVERVEVTKGPFDLRNAGSLGATVNVVTKNPEPGFSIALDSRFGSFGAYTDGVSASYGGDRVQVLAAYSYQSSDPYSDGHGQSFTAYNNYSALGRNAKAFDDQSAWFKAYYTPADGQQLSLSYTRVQDGLVLYPYFSMDSNHNNTDRAELRYEGKKISIFKNVRADVYYTNVVHLMSDSERTSAMNGVPTMTSPVSSRVIGGHMEGDLGGGFSVGVESYYRNWNVTGTMVSGGMAMFSQSLPDVNTYATGAYVAYRHAFTRKLLLTGGGRYDYASASIGVPGYSTDLYYQYYGNRNTAATDSYGSGNASLSYAAVPGVTLFAGVGSNGRIPDAEERFFARAGASSMSGMSGMSGMMQMNGTVGNPDLHYSRNTEGDVGAVVQRGPLRVRASLFYSNVQNFIMIGEEAAMSSSSGMGSMGGMGGASMPVTAITYNNVQARLYGGETSYDLRLMHGLSFTGSVSESIGVHNPAPGDGIHNTNIPEMPPLRGTLALRYVQRRMFAEVGALAADRQQRVDTDLMETPTPGYAVLNTKLGVTYRRFRVSFGIDNLLNRFYYQNLSYTLSPFSSGIRLPEAGRNFFGEVRWMR